LKIVCPACNFNGPVPGENVCPKCGRSFDAIDRLVGQINARWKHLVIYRGASVYKKVLDSGQPSRIPEKAGENIRLGFHNKGNIPKNRS